MILSITKTFLLWVDIKLLFFSLFLFSFTSLQRIGKKLQYLFPGNLTKLHLRIQMLLLICLQPLLIDQLLLDNLKNLFHIKYLKILDIKLRLIIHLLLPFFIKFKFYTLSYSVALSKSV
jgi:hypothetical protein